MHEFNKPPGLSVFGYMLFGLRNKPASIHKRGQCSQRRFEDEWRGICLDEEITQKRRAVSNVTRNGNLYTGASIRVSNVCSQSAKYPGHSQLNSWQNRWMLLQKKKRKKKKVR